MRWVNGTVIIQRTVNDLINTRIFYLVLRVQVGAFKRSREAFILTAVTSSTKLKKLFGQYPLYINRDLHRSFKSQHAWYVKILVQGYCVAIVSLSLLIRFKGVKSLLIRRRSWFTSTSRDKLHGLSNQKNPSVSSWDSWVKVSYLSWIPSSLQHSLFP